MPNLSAQSGQTKLEAQLKEPAISPMQASEEVIVEKIGGHRANRLFIYAVWTKNCVHQPD